MEKTKHPVTEKRRMRRGKVGRSESSDDSSDSGNWIDVESSGEDHLDVSDSDDEDGKNGDKLRKDDGDVNRTSTLATTKVCVEGLSSTSHSI